MEHPVQAVQLVQMGQVELPDQVVQLVQTVLVVLVEHPVQVELLLLFLEQVIPLLNLHLLQLLVIQQ
jgi:hypothetical protein